MDAIYPASNWLGVPDLDPGMAADCLPLPVWAWGSKARDTAHRGTWHLYVDDARFNNLFKDPGRLAATGCAAAVEPNPSAYDDTPLALALADVYRSRWVCRYWQQCGVRVFLDLNRPARLLDRPEFAFGIPAGWPAFATRGYDRRLEGLDYEFALAKSFSPSPVFLVVGGGGAVAEWCAARGALHSGYRGTREVYGHG